MKQLKAFIISLHKYLGTLMSSLFLMWCLTGFVLLFVGFPHASRQERFLTQAQLSEASLAKVNFNTRQITQGASLEMCLDRPVYRLSKGRKKQVVLDAETLEPIKHFSLSDGQQIALQYISGRISHSDTITQLDSWIPWSYYKSLLPFYKYYYDDDEHTSIYVSSKTGAVIQKTTRKSRWMARIGAIPHWVYFKQIKSRDNIYKPLITSLGVLGLLLCLSGIVLGFVRIKRNKQGRLVNLSVYKNPMFRYHHIIGLFFGLFLSTYILSGIFYTTGIPSWMVTKAEGQNIYRQWNTEKKMADISPQAIFSQLPEKTELRQLSWGQSMEQSVVRAYYTDYKIPRVYSVDSEANLHPFQCDAKAVLKLANLYFPQVELSLSTQESYDFYYEENGMYHHPLPVFKLDFNNATQEALYIDPNTGKAVEYFDKNKRTRRILTKTLHKMELPILYKYNTWRIIVSIMILSMCTILSYTSLILGLRLLKRQLKRRK